MLLYIEILNDYYNSGNQSMTEGIQHAYTESQSRPPKRKRQTEGDEENGPPKKKRGAVTDDSRIKNEAMLRPLFFNRRKCSR